MEGRSRHCPHLGLKHTRSIRFSSPTPEHRCYIFGEPLEIQIDQREYCLGERYPECPRFAGQEAPPAPAAVRPGRSGGKKGGLAAFWQGLGTRDRALYLSLLGLLVAILATYGILVGIVLPARNPTPTPVSTAQAVPTTAVAIVPTVEATAVPTAVQTAVPTAVPSAMPTARPTSAPTTAAATEPPPVTSPVVPTSTPRPTAQPTAQPTAAPTVVVPPPSATPESLWSTLFFLGPNRAYHVPVERLSRPYTLGRARRALELMIQGPLSGTLLRSMPSGMGVNWDALDISGGTLYLDLDHTFESLGAGSQEALAVVLAMTEFSTVSRVQFSVNGQPYGLPGSGNTSTVERPAYVNFEDPYNVGSGPASNLILYFATPDGSYLFPVVRRVPDTVAVAQTTIEEMIRGPRSGYPAITLLPAGTMINTIAREGNTIVVDFNSAFLNAANRAQTVNALALAMTDLTADGDLGVTAVRISVDGVDLGSHWGSAYSGNLGRPQINPEVP